jgi:hypothetical protein
MPELSQECPVAKVGYAPGTVAAASFVLIREEMNSD